MSFLSSDETISSLCEVVEHDEMPPFAMSGVDDTDDLLKQPLHMQSDAQSASLVTVPLAGSTFNPAQSTTSQPPALASSIMSCRTDGDSSQASSTISELASSVHWTGGKSSVFAGDLLSSRHLDAAASLMANMDGGGSYLPHISASCQSQNPANSSLAQSNHVQYDNNAPSTMPGSFSSMEFSRLMQNADDTQKRSRVVGHESTLPVLPEETEAAVSAQNESFHSAQGGRSASFPSNIASTNSQIISSDWVQVDEHAERFASAHSCVSDDVGYLPPQLDAHDGTGTLRRARSLDHSVGLLRRTGVSVRQLDPTSFEVSIDLSPGCAVDDVMEVIANPAYLVLWCESIRSLVITNSSEGARNAGTRGGTSSNGRQRAEYEGEWIEATTTDLISPPSTSSCFYSASKAVWTYVGFPSNYGTISMFVERQRGRVGISMGPFAGDVTVSHSFAVENMKIVDIVTLSRGVSSTELLCGVFECLESIFLPGVKGYMDQVVSSMIRLRIMLDCREDRS